MGLFNNWILTRAEKIKAKQEAKQKAERDTQQKQYENNQKIVSQAKDILYRSLEPIIETLEKTPCHIKEGDVAILNRYCMVHPHAQNGWDGGPNTFINHCHEDDKNTPIKCDILSIHVDTSFAHEKIDKWIDNRSYENLQNLIEANTLVSSYQNWYKHFTPKDMLWKEHFGLYKTAMFKAHFTKFNPSWGLNVGSFLEINTPEAKETNEIWLEEISLDFAYKQLDDQIKKLKERKREIDEKYRNIKYLN